MNDAQLTIEMECECGHREAQHPRGVCAVSDCKCESFEESESSSWARIKEDSKKKRWNNYEKSTGILASKGISFRVLDQKTGHLRVEERYDFWATTGMFIEMKTRQKGRGVFELIKALNK